MNWLQADRDGPPVELGELVQHDPRLGLRVGRGVVSRVTRDAGHATRDV